MNARLLMLSVLVSACAFSGAVESEPARTREGESGVVKPTPRRAAPERPAPFDPRDVRRGEPGRFDFGNGTEVRIGGRVRLDYDLRR